MTSYFIVLCLTAMSFQANTNDPIDIKLDSRVEGKKINLSYMKPKAGKLNKAVLFIHGASFPSALAAGFRMGGVSWMDVLAEAGYDVFTLDFLGYGKSDRYNYMLGLEGENDQRGIGKEVAEDIDIAMDYIMQFKGLNSVHLIGHSWGATVSGYYASLHPDKVDKLVLFAPFTERPGKTSWDKSEDFYKEQTPAARIAQFTRQIPEGEEMTLADEVLNGWGEAWLSSDPTSKSRSAQTVRYPRAWERDLYDCWNGNCFFKGENIQNASLIIRGEWDTAFSFEDAQNLFMQMKKARFKRYYVIDKSTHVLHLEKNRFALYELVQLFLKSN